MYSTAPVDWVSVSTVSMSKTVLFQAIQFSTSTQFSSIWPINRTLSGATTPSQSGSRSNGNERVIRIPKAPALLEPHHQFLYSHTGHSLVEVGGLLVCRDAVNVFYSPSRLGKEIKFRKYSIFKVGNYLLWFLLFTEHKSLHELEVDFVYLVTFCYGLRVFRGFISKFCLIYFFCLTQKQI